MRQPYVGQAKYFFKTFVSKKKHLLYTIPILLPYARGFYYFLKGFQSSRPLPPSFLLVLLNCMELFISIKCDIGI